MVRTYKKEPTIPALSQSTIQHQRVNISVQEHHREGRSRPWWSTANSKWLLCIFLLIVLLRLSVHSTSFSTDNHLQSNAILSERNETISTIMSTSNIICWYCIFFLYITCLLFNISVGGSARAHTKITVHGTSMSHQS